jgi:hypothetical protein
VAELLHFTDRTVRNWERGASRVPYAAFRLLRITSGYALPGHEWEGWGLRKGVLWSPTGQAFDAGSMGYLGLVFQMARQWAIEHGGGPDLLTAFRARLPDAPAGRARRRAVAGDPVRTGRGNEPRPDRGSDRLPGPPPSFGLPQNDPSPRPVTRGESPQRGFHEPLQINGLRKEVPPSVIPMRNGVV